MTAGAVAVLERVRAARDLLSELRLHYRQDRQYVETTSDGTLERIEQLDQQLVVAEKGLLLQVALDRVDAAGASEASAGAPVGAVPEAIQDALLQAHERIAAEPPAFDPPCPFCGACSKPDGATPIAVMVGVTQHRCTKCERPFFSEVTE